MAGPAVAARRAFAVSPCPATQQRRLRLTRGLTRLAVNTGEISVTPCRLVAAASMGNCNNQTARRLEVDDSRRESRRAAEENGGMPGFVGLPPPPSVW